MTYPTANPSLSAVGANIVVLLEAIPYLRKENGGTVVLASDPKQVLNFNTYATPFVIVTPAGETLRDPKNQNVGGALYETNMTWQFFVGDASFSLEGDGLTGDAVTGGPGIFAMIEDITTAVLGKAVHPVGTSASKMFPESPFHRRYQVTDSVIVWEMRWKNQWIRRGV